MSALTSAEKIRLARIFANAHVENVHLKVLLRNLVFAARTSGGVAGRDELLCAACDAAENALTPASLQDGTSK
jgi:hypothetical protein